MEDSPVWSLGSLTLDPDHTDPNGVLWFLSEETGFFGSPAPTAELTPKLNAHGAFRTPGYKPQRTISLKGYAFAPTYAKLRDAVNTVTGLLGGPYESVPLTCYAETGPVTCDVFLDGDILTQPVPAANPIVEWSLQVVAPDPRKYSTQWRTMRATLPRTGEDGLDFLPEDDPDGLDFTGGLDFGVDSGAGFLAMTNRGTAPAPLMLTLYGPLSMPMLTAGSTGTYATLRYNATLAEGEFVVIDPSTPTVLLGGTASRRELLNPAEFQGFYVPPRRNGRPGELSVGLSHSGPATDTGWVEVRFRDAWF